MDDFVRRSDLLKHSRRVHVYGDVGYIDFYAVPVEVIQEAPPAFDVTRLLNDLEEVKHITSNTKISIEESMALMGRTSETCKEIGCRECYEQAVLGILANGGRERGEEK